MKINESVLCAISISCTAHKAASAAAVAVATTPASEIIIIK